MKSMISSITDNVRARLKNPLIGAFIFSWVAIHVKGVSVFLLVDTQMKIEILRNKDWLLWGDVIFPLILSVAYLIVLPLVNLLYDRFESGWLTPQRLAISRNKTVAQVRAETDYIRDFEYNNLSALINGKKELSEAVDKLSDVVEEFGNNLTKDNEEKFWKLQDIAQELDRVVSVLKSSDLASEDKAERSN